MRRIPWIALATLAAAGCAPLPSDLPPRPGLTAPQADKTVATLAAESALDGKNETSPRWWEAFGDAQLNSLVETALRDNPSLAAAQARLNAAGQAERLAALDTGLHYDANATVVRERFSENGVFPPPIGGSTFYQGDLTLGVTYTVDWWGKNRALVKAAAGEAEAARAENADARLSVAALVADAWFAWGDVEERLATARTLVEQRKEALALAKTRLERGLDSALPSHLAAQKYAQEEDNLKALQYQSRAWRYRLAALLGQSPDQAASLPAPRLPAKAPALPASLPLDWLAHRPDVAAQRARVEAAAARSDATRADFYPNLDLRLLIGLQSLDAAKWLTTGSLNGSYGPALHIPLFNTSTLQTKLRAREAEYAAAVGDYNQTVLDSARQVADGYALFSSLTQRETLQTAALHEAEQARALAQSRYKNGLASHLDALDADVAALVQRQNETQTRAARLRAAVALEHALGGLQE